MSGFGSTSNNGVFGAPTSFGGGFGNSNAFPPLNSNIPSGAPFQQQQQQQQQPPPPQYPPPAQPFGTQPQPSSVIFGSSPNVAATVPVGGFGGGFGTSVPTTNQFHSGSSGNIVPFGAPQLQTPFASSSTVSSFLNTPLHNKINSGTAAVASSTTQQQLFTPFGNPSTSIAAPAFSTSSSVMTSNTTQQQSFGFSSNAPQPTVFPTASSIAVPNPFAFGNTPQNIPQQQPMNSVTFGMSSNVMNTTNGMQGSFGNSSSDVHQQGNAAVNTPFGSRYSTTSPLPNHFGTTANPFQFNQTISDGMTDDDIVIAPATAVATSNPFGASQQSIPAIADSNRVTELAKLQAKIAAKKKKIEEKKQRETNAAAEAAANEASTALRANATPFAPALASSNTADFDTSTVAQRNAIRFAESNDTTTRSQLPSDLQDQQSAEAIAAQTALRNSGGSGGRENLENAISLVGTCIYMCPDEELLRREREGDIQLLERPDVQIHPSSWTLRDTMVKRFRRSAADYKLDVPEWIRPPDVLEKVCGYLEEWVMERDRQGPDPRYKNVPSPPPLDVYQFVWDRTRMVRKDFILQNFVGTGGLVDARAVRCHERIARWHCLCEHQLSHISEYVQNQSQQNVQELGQTMKTLNQFYDDSMGRALREVPDDTGSETRTNLNEFAHGCGAESVQGQSPIDYDGTAMENTTNHVSNRLIGVHAVTSLHHGTAEPEMRGLYILLTIDNDGGLEVNKYASRIYEERPEVYHTKPVQLALSIYKAKIDRNYAKFFSILRSPSTPYLFACLMFKHVASMRKYAIYLMHKTYGARQKDGNIYETYPLRRLTSLLCFEDDDEARTACRHYHITVKTEENGIDMIYWKTTSFREAVDPEKGSVIPLRPRKMIKTIEGKLKGATRLAVCRGELSGADSYLSPNAIEVVLARNSQTNSTAERPNNNEYLRQLKDLERKQQEEHFKAKQQENLERQKHEEIQREARRKQEDEMKRRIQLEKQQQRQAQMQLEKEKLEKEQLDQKLRLEQEEKRRIEEELLLRQEAERQRKAEQERQEVLRVQREEQIKEELERNRRAEEELERQRIVELERLRREREEEAVRQKEKQRMIEFLAAQELERQRREAIMLQLKKEQTEKLDAARKIAVWIWCTTRRQRGMSNRRINDSLFTLKSTRRSRSMPRAAPRTKELPSWTYKEYSDRLGQSLVTILPSNQSNLNSLLASELCARFDEKKFRGSKSTILLTLTFIFPTGRSLHEQQLCRMIQAWLQSRFTFNEVFMHRGKFHDVRIIIVDNINPPASLSTCDAAVFIVPPPWTDDVALRLDDITLLSSFIDDDVPRLALAFWDRCDSENISKNSDVLSATLSGVYEFCPIVSNVGTVGHELEESILGCIEKMGSLLDIADIQTIDRMSVIRIMFTCISSTLWMEKIENREDIGVHAASVIRDVTKEILAAGSDYEQLASGWPSMEFASTTSTAAFVSDYFHTGSHLPIDWASTGRFTSIGKDFKSYSDLLEGSFSSAIHHLVIDAPFHVRTSCQSLMDQRLLKRCLQAALQWRMTKEESNLECRYVYLPTGVIDDILHRTKSSHSGTERDELKFYSISGQKRAEHVGVMDTASLEVIDRPPQETPNTLQMSVSKRRRFSDSSFTPILLEKQQPDPSKANSVSLPPISTEPKRRRTTSKTRRQDVISKGVSDSLSFTKKLENLLLGNTCVDLMIGPSFFLSTALIDAPPLITELDKYQEQL